MRSPRWLPWLVLIGAVSGLVLSFVWVSGSGPGPKSSAGPWGVTTGDGPVASMAAAERAADRFAERWGLDVGEVMEFSNGYYVELVTEEGSRATEVLVDPGSGAVQVEFGPARMWNTTYGMMRARSAAGEDAVSPDEAVEIADDWLREHRRGLHAEEPEAFPGYFTLHVLKGERIVGMLSVNEATGAVWYHGWHGRFIRMQESDHAEPEVNP